jgi:transcription initiation factor TFIID subunit 2
MTFAIAATPEPQTPGMGFQTPAVSVPEFLPITVNISYSLRNPVDGFQFVIPSEAYPYVSSDFSRRESES